ncbi:MULTISPECIES: hypothetical protein [unclassified Virgibacillus]|uniref:hypothetical protein n=1 Tax=unclassified Virgibacillus TaxID=2620237 RepID=UPI0024DED262|nr:hypothetical protein [Virgibacillus sp. LDC-1]
MTKVKKVNMMGWVIALIFGLLKFFYPEGSSFITTGPGGLLGIIACLVMITYGHSKGFAKEED